MGKDDLMDNQVRQADSGAARSGLETDKDGMPAVPEDERTSATMESELQAAEDGFPAIASSAILEFVALTSELSGMDPPSWDQQKLEGIVMFALGAATAGVGVAAAKYILGANPNEGVAESVKVAIEGGLNLGIAGAKAALSANKSKGAISAFCLSQGHGLVDHFQESQQLFKRFGKKKIKTYEQAKACADALRGPKRVELAVAYRNAARDAWVSSLAQEAFGSVEQPDGTKTTDVRSTEDHQDDFWKEGKGSPLDGGPGWQNQGEGMLNVAVNLPDISNGQIQGAPKITWCMLHGVNAAVRSQYAGKPLSQSSIPRYIEAYPDEHEDFSASLDEKGQVAMFPGSKKTRAWLAQRQLLETPNSTDDEMVLAFDGLKLLLNELIPGVVNGEQ